MLNFSAANEIIDVIVLGLVSVFLQLFQLLVLSVAILMHFVTISVSSYS